MIRGMAPLPTSMAQTAAQTNAQTNAHTLSPALCHCAIALGANLGHPLETLNAAIETLIQHPDLDLIARSSWYLTAAVGPPQPDYLNGCIVMATTIPPHELMTLLLAIEDQFGRVRQERWGARSLDLDLLLYDDQILQTPHLTLPHPRMGERAFVLVPLAEIAPDWIDPVSLQSIGQLCQMVDCSGVQLYGQLHAN
jgi:2-amino-4-hydroxy-6-hydroxymethyldihydropteridine diphosphokinase